MASIVILHVYKQAVDTEVFHPVPGTRSVPPSPGEPHPSDSPTPPQGERTTQTFSVLPPIPPAPHTHSSTPPSRPALQIKIYYPFLHHEHSGE